MPTLDEAMKSAVNEVVNNPVAHARLMRMSSALLAVSSIEEPNPAKAVGHMFGSAIEYLRQLGFDRKFILDFAATMYDSLEGEVGATLKAAAEKTKG